MEVMSLKIMFEDNSRWQQKRRTVSHNKDMIAGLVVRSGLVGVIASRRFPHIYAYS